MEIERPFPLSTSYGDIASNPGMLQSVTEDPNWCLDSTRRRMDGLQARMMNGSLKAMGWLVAAMAQTPSGGEPVPESGPATIEIDTAALSLPPRSGEPGSVDEPPTPDEVSLAESLAEEGVAAFEAGELRRALDLLERAFALDQRPNLVFNIGRIHEELGHLQLAIAQYELFVTWPGVDIDTREFAAQRAAKLRSILANVSTPDGEPTPVDDGPDPTPTPVTPVSREVGSQHPEPDGSDHKQRKRSPKLISGAVFLGVGAAALATGGALGGVAAARASAADDQEYVDAEDQLRDSARTLARAADGLLLAGGAIAVVGIVLVSVHVVNAKKQRAVSWVPSVGPTSVGFGWTGRF